MFDFHDSKRPSVEGRLQIDGPQLETSVCRRF